MAKGKHATALFEVIHSGKSSPKSLLSTPRWWFKKREQEQAAAARTSTPEESSDDPTLGRDPVDRVISSQPRAQTIAYSSQPAPSRSSSGMDVAVDADRQQITFKVSYTSAIIVTFSVLVAVGLAYLVGQKMSRGPTQALAGQSSEQLRAGPKNPGVMDVSQRNSGTTPQAVHREPDPAITSRGPDHNPDNVEPPAGTVNPTNPAQPRVLNLNYVVVQSYPDQKSAEEARDALVKAGIACTIEQKLKGWKPEWFCVVGMQGFQRASGNEYDVYVDKIIDVSDKFAMRKRSFKAFQPMAYKWMHPG